MVIRTKKVKRTRYKKLAFLSGNNESLSKLDPDKTGDPDSDEDYDADEEEFEDAEEESSEDESLEEIAAEV